MGDMIINRMPGKLLYIEKLFSKSHQFIEELELLDSNRDAYDVVPPWSRWEDGSPRRLSNQDDTGWEQVFDGSEGSYRGHLKLFDWDLSVNKQNFNWPRTTVSDHHSVGHELAIKLIDLVEDDLKKAIEIWQIHTDCPTLQYLSRNYCIKKYRTGASMGNHIDKNIENPLNTMDWTALVYLNDDYVGGEVVFPNLGLSIKPTAGSILFLPCLEEHYVEEIKDGNKYYMFFFIHLDTLLCTSSHEPYQALNESIYKYRNSAITI